MKRIFVGALVFLSVAALQAEEKKLLRVGVTPSNPPMEYWDRDKVVGLEADFARNLAKELNMDLQFIDMKFRELIPALLGEKIDIIMAGMSVTKVRDLQVAFCNPYMKIGQMPLVRLEDRNKYNLPFDVIMTDQKVGATENTTSEYLLVQEFPNAKKTLFSSQAKAVAALKKKSIDLLILDSPYILWLAAQNEGKLTPVPLMLTEENLAWAVRKSDKPLLNSINIILDDWKKSGQLDATIKQWLPN